MNLYYHQINRYPQASKPPVQMILIHGWAMNSAVWEELSESLADNIPVVSVDLPGYGQSPMLEEEYNLENISKCFEKLIQMAESSIILGWSFGGLVAMEIAKQYPEQVRQVILVGATPRFVQGEDWPHAVEADVFNQFADSLRVDIEKTISRFMVLQMLGSQNAKQDARRVSQSIRQQGLPNPEALEKGLDILLNEDRRQQMSQLALPISLICGSRDTLVKVNALEQLAEQDNIDVAIIQDAGHVPFVSHYEEFKTRLEHAMMMMGMGTR